MESINFIVGFPLKFSSYHLNIRYIISICYLYALYQLCYLYILGIYEINIELRCSKYDSNRKNIFDRYKIMYPLYK